MFHQIVDDALPEGSSVASSANTYRIQRTIGRGGFAVVYAATEADGTTVALKEYFPLQFARRDRDGTQVGALPLKSKQFSHFLMAFKEEAKNLQVLGLAKNPHIIPVYDVFLANGTAYFVMPFLTNDLSLSFPLGEERFRELAPQLLDAVEIVHKNKLIHRDIKPSNIILTKSGLVLLDFGCARDPSETTLTQMGSDGYAAPEQFNEKTRQGTYTDIYAIGATFYHWLTNRKPPKDGSRGEQQRDGIQEEMRAQGINEDIGAAIQKALAISPRERHQSTNEFLRALFPTWWQLKFRMARGLWKRLVPVLKVTSVSAAAIVAFLGIGWMERSGVFDDLPLTPREQAESSESTSQLKAASSGLDSPTSPAAQMEQVPDDKVDVADARDNKNPGPEVIDTSKSSPPPEREKSTEIDGSVRVRPDRDTAVSTASPIDKSPEGGANIDVLQDLKDQLRKVTSQSDVRLPAAPKVSAESENSSITTLVALPPPSTPSPTEIASDNRTNIGADGSIRRQAQEGLVSSVANGEHEVDASTENGQTANPAVELRTPLTGSTPTGQPFDDRGDDNADESTRPPSIVGAVVSMDGGPNVEGTEVTIEEASCKRIDQGTHVAVSLPAELAPETGISEHEHDEADGQPSQGPVGSEAISRVGARVPAEPGAAEHMRLDLNPAPSHEIVLREVSGEEAGFPSREGAPALDGSPRDQEDALPGPERPPCEDLDPKAPAVNP